MFGQSPLKQEANSLIQEINKQSCTYSTVADSYSKNSKYVVVHCSTHKSRIYGVFTQVFTVWSTRVEWLVCTITQLK